MKIFKMRFIQMNFHEFYVHLHVQTFFLNSTDNFIFFPYKFPSKIHQTPSNWPPQNLFNLQNPSSSSSLREYKNFHTLSKPFQHFFFVFLFVINSCFSIQKIVIITYKLLRNIPPSPTNVTTKHQLFFISATLVSNCFCIRREKKRKK